MEVRDNYTREQAEQVTSHAVSGEDNRDTSFPESSHGAHDGMGRQPERRDRRERGEPPTRRRSLSGRGIAGVVAVLILVIGALATFQLLQARQRLLAGSRDISAAVAAVHGARQITYGRLRGKVHDDLSAGLNEFSGARSDLWLWSPFLAHVEWVPRIGGQLAAASPAADASFYVTSAALHLLDGLSPVWPVVNDRSGTATPLLERLAPALVRGHRRFLQAQADADRAARSTARLPGHGGNASLDDAHARLTAVLPVLQSSARWLSVAPQVLGMKGPVHYLIGLQNPAELHATGGFLGAADYLTIRRGRLKRSFTSGALDFQDTQIAPPAPLGLLTNAAYWQFIYANWSPDFPLSARVERWIYGRGTGEWVDGVVNVQDTEIASLLGVTGPVYLPSFKVTVTAQNVEALSQRFVNREYHGPSQSGNADTVRKQFLGVLLDTMITRIQALPSNRWPSLASAMASAVSQRDLMLYDRSPSVEAAIRAVHADGSLRYTSGDVLFVVDDNRSDNKLNPYIREWGEYSVRLRHDLWANATLTLHYHVNPSPENLEGSGPRGGEVGTKHDYEDFLRVYVPPGVRLLGMSGISRWAPAPAYGMTQLAGDFIVREGQTRTVAFHYRIPANAFAASNFKRYSLRMLHQPASNLSALQVSVSGSEGVGVGSGVAQMALRTDRDRSISVPITGSGEPHTVHLPPAPANPDPYIVLSQFRDGKHTF